MVKAADIIHTVKIARVGVYKSIIKVIDNITGEEVVTLEREHPKRTRKAVARASLNEAYEIAREHGYDHITRLATSENDLLLQSMDI